jgi:hypothetical protein
VNFNDVNIMKDHLMSIMRDLSKSISDMVNLMLGDAYTYKTSTWEGYLV